VAHWTTDLDEWGAGRVKIAQAAKVTSTAFPNKVTDGQGYQHRAPICPAFDRRYRLRGDIIARPGGSRVALGHDSEDRIFKTLSRDGLF